MALREQRNRPTACVVEGRSGLFLPTYKEEDASKRTDEIRRDFQCNPRGTAQQDVRSVALTMAPTSYTSFITSAGGIVDSGAASHVTWECTKFVTFDEANSSVTLLDGQSVAAQGRGTVTFVVAPTGEEVLNIPLSDARLTYRYLRFCCKDT
jgi:hypothetical protein